MFKYEHERRPPSTASCDSRATQSTRWSQNSVLPQHYVRRPLPPRPDQVKMPRVPAKSTVPLKVWVIASASCFAVCGILVLATIAITRWGSVTYSYERPEPIYADGYTKLKPIKTDTTTLNPTEPDEPSVNFNNNDNIKETSATNLNDNVNLKETSATNLNDNINLKQTSITNDDDINIEVLGHLSRFRNVVANREKKRNQNTATLLSKPQLYPLLDTSIVHAERKIEKKDQAYYDKKIFNEIEPKSIPDFKPTLPDLNLAEDKIYLPSNFKDYSEYYVDDNLYEDYMQSNSMTSYLLEKVQELHEWITTDPDFVNKTKHNSTQDFSQVLKALNDSLVEGNAGILINKLKDLYFGDNFTSVNHSRKIILTNGTDLISFGILTLDVMLLHNIQTMAWENQEAAKVKMLKDPNVFAFNALFMDPSKVTAKHNEVNLMHDKPVITRRTNRIETADDFDFGKNLLENILEIGMSTARAAIHLGRAYKNTKTILNTLSNRDINQRHISRNVEGSGFALNHLQTSFDSSHNVANLTQGFHTDLDCVWLLYCRNLAATAKLNAPYGTMARINGIALRMLTGELATDKALNTMLFEALSGWTDLRCNDMFPRCSKVNAAAIVLDSIIQPGNKSMKTR